MSALLPTKEGRRPGNSDTFSRADYPDQTERPTFNHFAVNAGSGRSVACVVAWNAQAGMDVSRAGKRKELIEDISDVLPRTRNRSSRRALHSAVRAPRRLLLLGAEGQAARRLAPGGEEKMKQGGGVMSKRTILIAAALVMLVPCGAASAHDAEARPSMYARP